MKNKFPIISRMDSAGGMQRGVVEIDRESGLFTVRPHGKRRTYTMTLRDVADLVCRRVILSEMHAVNKQKQAE